MLAYEGLGLKLLTDHQLERIHLATIEVLEQTGLQVHGDEAAEILSGAGCRVDSKTKMVRFPQHVVEDAIQSAPSKVLLAAREPKKDFVLEKGKVDFTVSGTGVALVDPWTKEIRETTLKDVERFAILCDALDEVPRCGSVVTACDVPEKARHFREAETVLSNTSKHVGVSVNDTLSVERMVAIGEAIAGGRDALRERPVISLSTCPHSPLILHVNNTEVIIAAARAGVPLGVLTMALAGGTGPVTLAGSMVVTNAEVLGGIVLAQLVRRGNPVVYGSSTSMLDLLLSTAPAGAPEAALIGAGMAQLGNYYRIPTRVAGGAGDSKLSDAQIGHEKTLTAMLPALAGANTVFGMAEMESGITFSYGQLVMDAEFSRMFKRTLQGIAVNAESLAVDVIKAVGAGKNYLNQPHTLRHMAREQSRARLIDRRMREAWMRKGGKSLAERADEEALRILETHKPLPLDASVQARIREIVQEAENE